MLWPSPACFYRCQCLVGIDVTSTRAITKLINRITLGCWRFVFFVRIRHKIIGMARRAIRKEICPLVGDLLVILLVAAQACRRIAPVVYISQR